MSEKRQEIRYGRVSVSLSLLISILLHLAVFVLCALLVTFYPILFKASPVGKLASIEKTSSAKSPKIVVTRDVPEPDENKDEEKQKEFLKTSADQEISESPPDAHYISDRATRAEGGPKAPNDIKEMPAQDGEESKSGEIVLFNQERQEGVLEHDREGDMSQGGLPPRYPQVPRSDQAPDVQEANRGRVAPIIPLVTTHDVEEPQENREEADAKEGDGEDMAMLNNGASDTEEIKGDDGMDSPEESGEETNAPKDEQRDLLANAIRNTLQYSDMMRQYRNGTEGKSLIGPDDERRDGSLAVAPISPEMPIPSTLPNQPSPNHARPVYDPVFTAEAQPGFRTSERKTRTTGRFSFGRNASLNAATTPMGRYQMIIYRAVGSIWYRQCDANRDIIVPGTLRIRFLVDTKGKVREMRMMSKEGASTAQASFTYLSIKQAPIPAMPPEVAKELVGDKLELIFDFYF